MEEIHNIIDTIWSEEMAKAMKDPSRENIEHMFNLAQARGIEAVMSYFGDASKDLIQEAREVSSGSRPIAGRAASTPHEVK